MLSAQRSAAAKRMVGICLALAVVGLLGCSSRVAPPRDADRTPHADASTGSEPAGLTIYPVKERQAAPALHGRALDGRRISLADLSRGRVVFVNVWASWCAPCRKESPLLVRFADRLAGRGVRFVGINEQDSESEARAFVAETGSTYPHLVDTGGSLLRSLPMLPQNGIPSTLVIDRQGRIAARVIGPVKAADIKRIVATLTSYPPAGVARRAAERLPPRL